MITQCWNLNTSNVWQKHTSRNFSANDDDAGRNSIYDRLTPDMMPQRMPVGANKYVIQSNMSNHYILDNPGSSSTNGQRLVLYSMNGTTGTANQQWTLEAQ